MKAFLLFFFYLTISHATTPFLGAPVSLPGRVEVEDYDIGGQGVAYFDTTHGNEYGLHSYRNNSVDFRACTDSSGCGLYVGKLEAGEWLKYTVNVSSAGSYNLNFRVATAYTGKSFYLESNGRDLTGIITVPNTGGWQAWRTISVPVTLSAGIQVFRLVIVDGGFNLNYFTATTVTSAPPPQQAAFSVAYWNIRSGFGSVAAAGTPCNFTVGSNCSTNAWGGGNGPFVERLRTVIRDNPRVIAFGISEAWTCATPTAVANVIGFQSVTGRDSYNGDALLVRYGIEGTAEVRELPRCSSTSEPRYAIRAKVYTDASRTHSIHVFVSHWTGCDAEARAVRDFAQEYAYQPRIFVGDTNETDPYGSTMGIMTGTNYRDVWRSLYPNDPGYTSTWNSTSRGLYKRIDYALTKTLNPVGMTLFNHEGPAGYCKDSDHAGFVVDF